ncbi:probable protein phosphatase 2C 4 [Coffea arabica]|uniref:Probable protein phosphatase 2C 4 n=1 Tax=Coffea arabica TaxID=13443 RepID=A0ABM4ULF6_COFAR|nr:probable protein phosphatase 2C 4 [Coffea arabica]
MGNGIAKLNRCFAGDAGEISRRHHDIAVYLSDPLDEGLGHSFCYIRPDSSSKTILSSSSDSSTTTSLGAAFRTISGASISANTSTPLSTSLIDLGPYNASLDKAAAFESSNLFASIPLQPIPRKSISSVRSGPIPRVACPGSGPIERGFLSGPIERSFISGPLENQEDQFQRYRPKPKKWALIRNFKKVMSKSFWSSAELSWVEKNNENGTVSGSNSSTSNNNLSCRLSLADDHNFDDGNESFGSQNVQWAQGKAGEDRVHIVISDERGWVFVGIYDGFNGPDATDFLLNNLYSNVCKELKGLLWNDKSESFGREEGVYREFVPSEGMEVNGFIDTGGDLKMFNNLGPDGVAGINHMDVLKALSEALRKTEASYLEIADMMLVENPELALMGSCVLAMLMKGDDVYLMNVGDSRAVLAQNGEPDPWFGKVRKDLERIREENQNDLEAFDGDEFGSLHHLTSRQLTVDHATSVKEESQRIRSEHPDDGLAIVNDRVKGSLKVTRAFGAGFLKQPKWNDALLQMFRIHYVGTSPYVTCSPSLFHHRLCPRDRFLILSSDGLYQYLTNQEAVTEVENFMSSFPEGDPAQHLVEEVLFRAAKKAGMDFHELLDIPQGDRRRYHDDVSVIIISFEGRIWRSSV